MKGLLKEFETFAIRGNAIDLAVGVLIGAAFTQITTSLSSNIFTPIIGLFAGGFDFSHLSVTLGGNAVLNYGAFIQAILNFLITATVLFLFLKTLNRLFKRKKQEEKKEERAESEEVKVLKEIRELLKRDA